MSNSFEWHTEEVEQWPEATAVASEPERPSRWRWLVALVIVCLAAVAGWVVYRQVDRRIAEATAHVEADVLSAHNVVRQAALQQDVELFTTMLSGRNSRWTAAQRALVDDGLLLDRASFGFTPAPANVFVAGPEIITVTLASDLTAAEVTCPVLLVVGFGARFSAAALLGMTFVIQTFVYPENWSEHLLWAALLLHVLTRGAGLLSLDHLSARWLFGPSAR